MRGLPLVLTLGLAAVIAVGGCGTGSDAGTDAAGSAPPSSSSPAAPPAVSSPASAPPSESAGSPSNTAPPPVTSSAARRPVVVLDAGHNGGNAGAPSAINRQVPAGRGEMKPCNTTGTATNDGYPEHAFTFDVTQRVAVALRERGVDVRLTREDDEGIGPCVDERAAVGNSAGADAVVSIHADGSNSPGVGGFHVAYSDPPVNTAQGEPSVRLAETLRAGLSDAGFSRADYIGHDGLAARDDLAGLNLSERPVALVECGNMRNPAEAARMVSADGRAAYADAIARGIATYLEG